MVTGDYKWLQEVIGGFKGVTSVLQVVTRGYRGLQGVTGRYKWLQGVTKGFRGYKGLQGVRSGVRG